jgi:peptidoglycan hydrolase CwlO-like protein
MKKSDIEAKLTKHDRQIEAIQKLIATGVKMIVRNNQQIAKNSQQITQLTKNVNTLVKSLERGQNGSRNPGSPRVH